MIRAAALLAFGILAAASSAIRDVYVVAMTGIWLAILTLAVGLIAALLVGYTIRR